METKIEEYVRARSQKDELETELKVARRPFQEEIVAIEEKMKKSTEDLSTTLSTATKRLKQIGEEVINEWEGPPTIDLEDGTKIVRSALRSVKVLNKRELLGTLISLIQDEGKLPFTVKWHDKGVIPLIDTNIIPADVATIETNYRLSVRAPKE